MRRPDPIRDPWEDMTSSNSNGLGLLLAFLDHDDRPTFILDVAQNSELLYQNTALRDFLLSSADAIEHFDEWANTFDPRADPITFGGRPWTSFLLEQKWRIIRADSITYECQHSAKRDSACGGVRTLQRTTSSGFSAEELRQKAGLTDVSSDDSSTYELEIPGDSSDLHTPPISLSRPSLDWLKDPPQDLPDYFRFFLHHHWATTPLGPIEAWPDLLRQIVITILSCPDPRLLLWGSNMCLVYNEACLALIGQKHPGALGFGPAMVFSELWNPLKSIVKLAMQQGKATKVQEMQLAINRDTTLGMEETYWSFTILPIIGPDGTAMGALDEFVESTSKVIGDRRVSTLIDLGEKACSAECINDLWSSILAGLEPNPQDITFVLLYSVDGGGIGIDHQYGGCSTPKVKSCYLEGTLGIPEGHPAAIPSFPLTEGNDGFSVPFRRAWTSAEAVVLRSSDGTLPDLLSGLSVEGRGFNEPSKAAVALPIPPLSGTHTRGFLIIGLNPRRPYNEDYQVFIRLLNDRLVKAAASVFGAEEQRRNRELIEETNIRHHRYSLELERRRQEAESSEATFTTLLEGAPIGCVVFQLDGQPVWMNQAYLDLSGLKREDFGQDIDRWSGTVIPDDREYVEEQWRNLAAGETIRPFEFRVKRSWKSPDSSDGSQELGFSWVLANSFLKYDDAGEPQRILGWLTDITHQKWSQHLQARRLEDVLENKRQSERFIDMTSHEMRNPLSAIIQSADGILTSLQFDQTPLSAPRQPMDLDVDTQEVIIDSAQTVILCAQHQKRIVDDITLSKLDTNLLIISPDIVQPVALVERAIKMYEAEFKSAKIKLSFSIHQSYDDLGIDTVLLDPSRLLQVLINLTTNAIKFTRDRKKRSITIFLSASTKQPSSGHDNLAYIPRRNQLQEHTFSDEWDSGEDIYLQLTVEDTGKGLTEDEMKLLFHRFSQASPKTYGEYGGSGLGLFISRELTELHGGQIGVASRPGKGSTFTFYVKARRCMPQSTDIAPGSPIDALRTAPLRQLSSQILQLPTISSCAESTPLAAQPITPTTPTTPVIVSPKPGSQDLKVLIVEDNPINQKVLAQQLRLAGCTTHLANHGLEALAALARSSFAIIPPDAPPALDITLVLMDLEMPVMDGLTCVRRIRAMEDEGLLTRHVPVIAVTANARNEQIATAIEAGMDEVVTKPFRVPELLERMEALMRGMGVGEGEGEGGGEAGDGDGGGRVMERRPRMPMRERGMRSCG